MTKPPKLLNDFQYEFSRQLRAQDEEFTLPGISQHAAQIYRDLVFNNLRGFIDRCFPVAQTLISGETWHNLVVDFFKKSPCQSPVFNEIPYAFVNYVYENHLILTSKPWLGDLLHYEWLELFVDLHTESVIPCHDGYRVDMPLRLNPTLMNQTYNWPVQDICTEHIPTHPSPTHLLVFRNSQNQVQFMEINPMTSSLLNILEQHPGSRAEELLNSLCALQPDFDRDKIQEFGQQLILDLVQCDAILSAHSERRS